MTMPISAVLGVVALSYVVANVFFALAYLTVGGVTNMQPGSFADAFFFSVQTMATIGYGNLYPTSIAANILATVEVVYGLLTVALSTGVMFARVSRPSARVAFSRVAVICPHGGRPTLMLRAANQRRNQIVEAEIRVALLRDEISIEGHQMRRFYDLPLARSRSPIFGLTWTVMHPIDEASPLHAMDAATLKACSAEIICSIVGLDETVAQPVLARHTYLADDLRWNARLADIFVRHPDGSFAIDYTRFHDTAE